jgi:translation initiation factor 1
MDWKSSLEALKANLPDIPETPEETTAAADSAPTGAARHPRLDIMLDKKGRKGKMATIVSEFDLDDDKVSEIAARLKQLLGTGGSARCGEILIQGDKRQQLLKALSDMGFKARII